MLPFTRSRTRRTPPASRPLHVEALERREVLTALAGNVTAQLVGSTLRLTGDALGNQLLVASVTGGRIAVIGGDTTVNGSVNPFVTSGPVAAIVVNLNGGDDVIGFGNSAVGFAGQLYELGVTPPSDVAALQDEIDSVANGATTFSLPGSLTISTGAGADAVGLIGTVGGSVCANLGSAPAGDSRNGLLIGSTDPAFASRVGGSLAIVGGAQRDFAEVLRTSIAGGVSAALGDGENYLGIFESSIASLAYTGGAGRDSISTPKIRIRNGVSIATGAGRDDVFVGAGDALVSVGGSVAIDTGVDSDFVGISAIVDGGVSVVTGEGDDRVGLYSTSVNLNAVIKTGAGNDEVDVVESRVRSNLLVCLGAGNDRLLMIGTTSIFAAYLDGGPGTNNLAIDEVARAGIRWLYSAQFQSGVG